jgi:hypothetical protein
LFLLYLYLDLNPGQFRQAAIAPLYVAFVESADPRSGKLDLTVSGFGRRSFPSHLIDGSRDNRTGNIHADQQKKQHDKNAKKPQNKRPDDPGPVVLYDDHHRAIAIVLGDCDGMPFLSSIILDIRGVFPIAVFDIVEFFKGLFVELQNLVMGLFGIELKPLTGFADLLSAGYHRRPKEIICPGPSGY